MPPTTPFKRLILRAVLRNVSPMVIRLVSVSDRTDLPGLHDTFHAILGWSGDLGYIVRVHVADVAERLEEELGDEQFCFVEGSQRGWDELPSWIMRTPPGISSSLSISPSIQTSFGSVWFCWRSARSDVCANAKQCNTRHSGVDV
jgi:hypothetical protein